MIKENNGFYLRLYDGLRTVEAQAKMGVSEIVKANPHWLEEPRLLSPAGAGAHPRGMAIDVTLEYADGTLPDMGTEFDYLAQDSSAAHNPAHRDYQDVSTAVRENRQILTDAFMDAARLLALPLVPLPQEWWDFRFSDEYYGGFAPISAAQLPDDWKMCLDSPRDGAGAPIAEQDLQTRRDEVVRDVQDAFTRYLEL